MSEEKVKDTPKELPNPEKLKYLVLPLSTVQLIANYLGNRPYLEVENLIQGLKQSVDLDSILENTKTTKASSLKKNRNLRKKS